jgi:hypothetical protein
MAAYTTIDNPELYFQVKLYSGTGSSQAITLDGDTDMQPDLVWVKERGGTASHGWTDSVRGLDKYISSEQNIAEYSLSNNGLSAFGSDGFTVVSHAMFNGSSKTYVAWCWKANGSGSSNTDGSINTTKTSANTTSGFSINTFTGSGSAATIGHGLSAVPEMIISKETGGSNAWYVYHVKNGNTHGLRLSATDAKEDDATLWNDTTPTSTVYSVGSNTGTNDSTAMVSYVFAPKQGFSKIGSYTGNGNADGTFTYTGFRPAWIMFKNASAGSSNWQIYDNKREGYNGQNDLFRANSSNAEGDGVDPIDILSNGFKQLNTAASNNVSGQTYVYMAFAEAPFVNSKGVPCNAR